MDRDDSDGLFDELADLANEVAGPVTNMLRPRRFEDKASPYAGHTGRDCPVSAGSFDDQCTPSRDRPTIDLAELRAALDGTMIENRYQPIIRFHRSPSGWPGGARSA